MTQQDANGVAVRTGAGFNAILRSLARIVAKLAEISREDPATSVVKVDTDAGRAPNITGIYGFTLRSQPGGAGFLLDSFGNVRVDEKSGEAMVTTVREPIVEVMSSGKELIVRAEIPGVSVSGVGITVHDQQLVFRAEQGERKYRKEMRLPFPCRESQPRVSGEEGLIEIRLQRAG